MDALTCAKELSAPIVDLGGRFMLDPPTFASAPEVGLEPGIGYYAVGRFGFLGKISGAEVNDIAVFPEPGNFAAEWEKTIQVAEPEKVAERFLQCCADWGRTNLAGIKEAEQFATLAHKVIDSVDLVPHSPLYMALREVKWPEDAEAKAAVTANILRELRFSHHTKALKAVGFDPLKAILISSNEDMARMFGWSDSFPEITDEEKTQRREVEDETDKLSADDFMGISEEERQELVSSAKAIIAAL